jgi:hypothetical protein
VIDRLVQNGRSDEGRSNAATYSAISSSLRRCQGASAIAFTPQVRYPPSSMNEHEQRLAYLFDDAMKLRDAGDLVAARHVLELLVEQLDTTDKALLSHAHSQLGYICKLLGDQHKREAHFRAAVTATPEYDLPSLGLFHALYDCGLRTDAFREMVRLLQRSYSKQYAEMLLGLSSPTFSPEERALVAEARRLVAKRHRS